MNTSKKNISIDLMGYVEALKEQFQDLDPKDPSLWPVIPKVLLCAVISLFTAGAAWYFYLSGFEEDLQRERGVEVALRADFEKKLLKAVSLDGLKKQREQVQQSVIQLEKQLPSKSEMAALLSDINQAGLGRSLQFELFKPGTEAVQDYYAELPISVRVSGNFHDMGLFASDISHLSRIVTLNNVSITPKGSDGTLLLDATAKTYRYLDSEEIKSQSKTQKSKAQKSRAKGAAK
ncbi:type IV pilus inner membrane component PilO [Comamonas avium]|jgi:type IV pilus assembly protein PilO|uniref:Type 4a pilus biogenesis protein PilO n=1 Tax=Comamonas avium TaxID=2762231 RepID=A0ABR8SE93_9BURK|nr:type 4a pilus biogenesis protein PilO [Comamonas avium]MBD7961803.1 type 4a pilus biogenesis protein PilO [Comamonas avium]